MKNDDETATPGELLQILEYAEMADAFADPILRVAERIHEKGLGKKAGRLVEILAKELAEIAKPVYLLLKEHTTNVRRERKEFVINSISSLPYQDTETRVAMVKAAVEILRMERNEQNDLIKSMEIGNLKARLNKAEGRNDSSKSVGDLLALLRNQRN